MMNAKRRQMVSLGATVAAIAAAAIVVVDSASVMSGLTDNLRAMDLSGYFDGHIGRPFGPESLSHGSPILLPLPHVISKVQELSGSAPVFKLFPTLDAASVEAAAAATPDTTEGENVDGDDDGIIKSATTTTKVDGIGGSGAPTGQQVPILPAYCDPPNPCPPGDVAERDGCIDGSQFENTAEFSRAYQAQQQCLCDVEHMFVCADGEDGLQTNDDVRTILTDAGSVMWNIDGDATPRLPAAKMHVNPYMRGTKLSIAAKKG